MTILLQGIRHDLRAKSFVWCLGESYGRLPAAASFDYRSHPVKIGAIIGAAGLFASALGVLGVVNITFLAGSA